MDQSLANQVAIITGAGSGLGAALARALAAAGARCVLAGRRTEPLENLKVELGDPAQVIPCDVRAEAQIETSSCKRRRPLAGLTSSSTTPESFRCGPLALRPRPYSTKRWR
jgi:short-subunit dehydrogenase